MSYQKPPLLANEPERLQALHRYNILDTPREREFEELAWLAALVCGTPIAVVSLIDADRQWLKAARGIVPVETPRDQSFCAHAIARPDEMTIIEDASRDARFAANPSVLGEPRVRFYAGAPLVTHDGHALGTLSVMDRIPRNLTIDQIRALSVISSQVMSRLELRRQAADALSDVKTMGEVARLKDEFVATVSHELRTPLTSIRGSLQLVLDDGADRSPEEEQLLTIALGNAERLIRMVNDILDIAKIEAGRLTLHLDEVGVGQLLDEAVRSVSAVARVAGIPIDVRTEPDLPPLRVDRDRIVQALVNLLSNALKFAAAGTAVEVVADGWEGGVDLTVLNRGSVIPPAKLGQLFQKFSQLSEGSLHQGRGTGLGLTITKALVEQHGGRISVASDSEGGTRFTISLPRAAL